MNRSYSSVIARLEEQKLAYRSVATGDDGRVIVLLRGGRLLGPFIGESGESLSWLNPAFGSAENFAEFLKSDRFDQDVGDWNIGGERVYIGPELQFCVPDRNDFWNSYTLPPAVDPGSYDFQDRRGSADCEFGQEVLLTAHPSGRRKALELSRVVRPAANPLRHLSIAATLLSDIEYCGYEHCITLAESMADGIGAHSWDLLQIPAGGEIILPCFPGIEFTNYYHPTTAVNHRVAEAHLQIPTVTEKSFKTGYSSAQVLGRVGYLSGPEAATPYLIVRNFPNDPSASYDDEPHDKPGERGDSLQVYVDDGSFGDFAEIECIGRGIGGATGRARSEDSLTTWCFRGPRPSLSAISAVLLGVRIE